MNTNRSITSRRGNILAALMFTLLCGALCMTLLTHSISSNRIMSIRRARRTSLIELENRLSLEIHNIFHALNRIAPTSSDNSTSDLFSHENFPDHCSDETCIQHDFDISRSAIGGMEKTLARDRILATRTCDSYAMEAEIRSTILDGRVPFQLIPFLLKAELPSGEMPRHWLNSMGVNLPGELVPVIRSENTALDLKSVTRLALDLGGLELTWKEIRGRLGFPISDEPLPGGVYIIPSPDCIHAILVQGDLNRLVFSSHQGYQRILMDHQGQEYAMEYEPEGTILDCWVSGSLSRITFSENIVINGDCLSVSTGQNQGEESKAFHPDSRLTLLVSGDVTITSSLEKDSLGIRKIPSPGISIITGKSGVISNGGNDISLTGTDRITLDAAMITNGVLRNEKSKVTINGSLCAGGLDNQGNITMSFSPGEQSILRELSAENIHLIQGIHLVRIEEVYRDDIN